MNQQIADAVRALPPALQSTYILGWLYLLFCYLSYFRFIRTALWRDIRAAVSPRVIDELLPRRADRVFFGRIRKKAHLSGNAWYTVNRALLPSLLGVTFCHAILTALQYTLASPPPALFDADRLLLSILFFAVCVLSLMTQPRATIELRTKWGFRPFGNTVHALLWEVIIVLLLFLWLYVAYFLVLL